MNFWMLLNGRTNNGKKPNISRYAFIHHKSQVLGKVFIGDHTKIGHSKIITEDGNQISIGKETVIKDQVLITAKNNKFKFHDLEPTIIKDIFIGNKVFISSEVSLYGPTLICESTFIGCKTTIVNSKIGKNCVIEDNVLIKNVIIPPDIFIPRKSIIDSIQKLNELIITTSQSISYHQDILRKQVLARAI